MQVLGRERPRSWCVCDRGLRWLLGGFIESNGRFQHQHDLKAFRADITDHPGNLIGFGYGLVNGFAKLLNEIAYLTIQIQPPRARTVAFFLPYFGFDKTAMT